MKERKKSKKRGEREPRTRVGSLKYFINGWDLLPSSFVVGVCVCVSLCVYVCMYVSTSKMYFFTVGCDQFLTINQKSLKCLF